MYMNMYFRFGFGLVKLGQTYQLIVLKEENFLALIDIKDMKAFWQTNDFGNTH